MSTFVLALILFGAVCVVAYICDRLGGRPSDRKEPR